MPKLTKKEALLLAKVWAGKLLEETPGVGINSDLLSDEDLEETMSYVIDLGQKLMGNYYTQQSTLDNMIKELFPKKFPKTINTYP